MHHIYDAAQVKEQSFATIFSFLVVTTDGLKKKIKNRQLQLEARITGATVGIM